MKIEFDPAQSVRNAEQRGLPFDVVLDFNWETALINPDERFLYPELRFSAPASSAIDYIFCVTPQLRVVSESSVFVKQTKEKLTVMKKPLINEDGEIRELTAADMRRFRPAKEVLSPELYAILTKRGPGERGSQIAPVKQQVTLRLDQDVLNTFRATGDGWQSRINEALRKAAKQVTRPTAS